MKKMIFILVFFFFLTPGECIGAEVSADRIQDTQENEDEAAEADAYLKKILEELNLGELDDTAGEILPQKVTFSELVQILLEDGFGERTVDAVAAWILDLFFYELSSAKIYFVQIVLLAGIFVIFGQLYAGSRKYVSEIGFSIFYCSMILILMKSFLIVSTAVQEGVSKTLQFLETLIPAYATTLMLSGNLVSAGIFYEMTFGIIFVVEWLLSKCIVPAIHIYVLVVFLDHIFKKKHFSKLNELIECGIVVFRKVSVFGVLGLGVVQSLIAPAKDRLTQSTVFKTLSVLPGIGNGVHYAEEVILSCGILVKNSVGIAGMILLLVVALTPVFKVFCFTFLYKLLVAVLQPITDTRIVECVSGVAKGSD